jgi:membrane protease YdiL (CAAX protease family)
LKEATESVLIVSASAIFGAIGLAAVFHAAAPYYLKNDLVEFEIGAYQFLTLGVVLSVVLLLIPRYHIRASVLGFRFPGWQTLFLSGLAYIPIFFGVILVSALLMKLFPGYLQSNAREILQGNQKLTISQEVVLLFWASVQAPLTEELLFRGIIFQGLRHNFTRKMSYGPAVLGAAFGSSILFGLAHFEPHTLPILIFLGISLAYVFQYTRSIYCSALVHGINNFLALLTLFHGM